ncbi:three-helix bundle dimerization domain-containing protein [Streptomyces lavendulae]|uniref:three-helix bundle dimerization domain-containing protein n=1 Tax=Streptomyces lavendulae TaxID=1914 RepID=UPI003673702E
MTVGERAPGIGACRPAEGRSRPAGQAEGTDPVAPPELPRPGPPDEPVALRDLVARLEAAYPTVDAVTVEAAVRAAYDSFHRARIRAYIPILAERRSRRALDAACRAAHDEATGDGGAIAPGPAKGW